MSHAKISCVIDLSFGDSGKGAHVDYLCRNDNARLVVRFNGGNQAGHNVVTPEGLHHCFHLFGSGSFIPGVNTYLAPTVLVNIQALLKEVHDLNKYVIAPLLPRMFIHEDCPIITPYHIYMNRYMEILREDSPHGSCGQGIGACAADLETLHPALILRIRDIRNPEILKKKLQALYDRCVFDFPLHLLTDEQAKRIGIYTDYLEENWINQLTNYYVNSSSLLQIVDNTFFANALEQYEHIVFEGAQGVLLDEWYGFHPYTTWSSTNLRNVHAIFDQYNYAGEYHNYGLLRAYTTRHGAGPFPTEDSTLLEFLNDEYNPTNEWQQDFRVGHFDPSLVIYAIRMAKDPESKWRGIDSLVISNVDRMFGLHPKIASHYHITFGQKDINHQAEKASLLMHMNLSNYSGVTHDVLSFENMMSYIKDIIDEVGRFVSPIGAVSIVGVGPTSKDRIVINTPIYKS